MVPAGVGWAEGWGLLLQRRGDCAHGECGGHAVPSHLALRLPIPQPQPSSWPRIGQALGSEQPVGSQWAGCAPPKPVALPHCLRRGRCSESLTSQWCPAWVLTSTTASLRASLRAPVKSSSPGVHFRRASPSVPSTGFTFLHRISFRRFISGRSPCLTTYGSHGHCTPPARFRPPCQRYRSGRHRSSHHPFLRLPR